ncbi:MAG: hypothetical protein HY866_04345 [Chloroflexi bacterium]|nr:hypothetical protein [Chloroflexota bacterium]
MALKEQPKVKNYTRYPLSSIALYNGVTVLHFVLGGLGIMLGYHSWLGYLLGFLYLAFAFGQMYIIVPLAVCPNCVYYRMENSLCISAMNRVSKKIASEGNPDDFPKRGEGLLCHNHLYMAALFAPILLIIPALILDFSFWVLGLLLVVLGLLLYRFFIVFPQKACNHCYAKYKCPNAKMMNLQDT